MIVRRLEPADAPQLVRCFERCYGRTYPSEVVYDEARLAALVAGGELRSVVAVDDDGAVLAHTGLKVPSPRARVVEAGHTVVDPATRGQGVLAELGAALFALCAEEGFAGWIHFPTTVHEIMQRASVRFGGVETGVMLAYIPAETEYVAVERDGPAQRVAVTVVYQPVGSLGAGQATLPARHAPLLARLFEALGAERTWRPAEPPRGESRLREERGARRGLLRVGVERIGDDLAVRVGELEPAPVAQVDLPLADPGVDDAVERLAALGFHFCGLLPELDTGDVLRLQRVETADPGVLTPTLANDGARELLAYIDRDRLSPTP